MQLIHSPCIRVWDGMTKSFLFVDKVHLVHKTRKQKMFASLQPTRTDLKDIKRAL